MHGLYKGPLSERTEGCQRDAVNGQPSAVAVALGPAAVSCGRTDQEPAHSCAGTRARRQCRHPREAGPRGGKERALRADPGKGNERMAQSGSSEGRHEKKQWQCTCLRERFGTGGPMQSMYPTLPDYGRRVGSTCPHPSSRSRRSAAAGMASIEWHPGAHTVARRRYLDEAMPRCGGVCTGKEQPLLSMVYQRQSPVELARLAIRPQPCEKVGIPQALPPFNAARVGAIE